MGARGGIEVMDVAISGSTSAAEEDALTLLVGGNRELFRAAKPIFQAVAKYSHLMGDSGSGTAMKLVVNTMPGVGMQAIAEAVALGEKAGSSIAAMKRVSLWSCGEWKNLRVRYQTEEVTICK
jgi:3-hydroxyisobutyrate dehydrogenase-like beta-hydroxyacid dehydrogenase